jgi:beta-lactamase regulating signal transducer with metallopeptidase domain
MHFFTHSFLLKALGSALLNSFWQMALMWLVGLVITGSSNRLSARIRHGISLSLLLAGSSWVFLNFVLSIVNAGSPDPRVEILGTQALPAGLSFLHQILTPTLPYLSFAYILIVFFLAVRHSVHHFHVIRLRRDGLHKVQPRIKLFVDTIAQRMGIHRRVMIWFSDLVDGPLTLGFYKPVILFPLAVVNQLSMEQVEAILLHELAHIRRHDYVINLLISWLGILFFFNPFVRMMIREIRKEREHCCDDLVLQFKYEPHTYASALLSLERSRFQHSGLVLAAAGRSRQLLLDRVKRLSGQKIAPRRLRLSAMAFLFISLTGAEFLRINPLPPIPVSRVSMAVPKQDKAMVRYVTTGFIEKSVQTLEKKVVVKKHSKAKKVSDDLVWVVGQDKLDGSTEATPALSAESREFSIESSTPTTPQAVSVTGMDHPYVPGTSFNYHLQVDTSSLHFFGRDDEAQYALQNVTLALDQLSREDMNIQAGKGNDAIVDQSVYGVPGYYNLVVPNVKTTVLNANSDLKNNKVVTVNGEILSLKKAGSSDKQKYILLQRTIRRNQLIIQKQNLENELKFFKIAPVKNKRTVVYI